MGRPTHSRMRPGVAPGVAARTCLAAPMIGVVHPVITMAVPLFTPFLPG
jgi:hypothetical protein